MPTRAMPLRNARLAHAKLWIENGRAYHQAFAMDGDFGSDCDRLLVAVAVLIGHLEGRGYTASSMSRYLAMSRTTVTRKLTSLVRMGVVEETAGHRYIITRDRAQLTGAMLKALKRYERLRSDMLKDYISQDWKVTH